MKDKNTAGLLAFLLGYLGIHRFYLNQPVLGVVYLLTGGVCFILPIIDAIILFTMDDHTFDQKYNAGATPDGYRDHTQENDFV